VVEERLVVKVAVEVLAVCLKATCLLALEQLVYL
jgi:hypothetical protein